MCQSILTVLTYFTSALVIAIVAYFVHEHRKKGLEKEAKKDNNQGTKTYDKEIAKTLLLHFDNLFYNRVNIFFVAEAIFFAAFGVLSSRGMTTLMGLVCVTGFIITWALWYTLRRLQVALHWLAEIFKELEPSKLYKDYTALGHNVPGSAFICVWIVPPVMALFWVYALLVTCGVLN